MQGTNSQPHANINITRLLKKVNLNKNSKEIVLVTGANGFLSSHIIEQLLTLGYAVRGTVRNADDKAKYAHFYQVLPENVHSRLSFVSADLTQEAGWDEAVSGATFVIHVASPFYYDAKTEDELVQPAVKGTQHVLNACIKNSSTVKKVVVTSSGKAVFEGNIGKVHFNESNWSNLENTGFYGKSKYYAEKEAWKIYESNKNKLNLTVINPTLILGPSLSPTLSSSLNIVVNLLSGRLQPIPVSLGVVDVRDAAAAHIICIQDEYLDISRGKRFIVSAQSIWIKDIAAICADYYKTVKPELKIQTKELTHEEFVAKSEVVPFFKEVVKQSGWYFVMDHDRSVRELDMQFTSIHSTVIDTGNELIRLHKV